MKKLLAVVLTACLCGAMLIGCGDNPANGSATNEGDRPLVGVCLPSVSTSLNEQISAKVTDMLEPECEVKTSSAESSVSTQVQQIQNYITMGAEMIVVVPTEMEAITDVLIQAREAGVKVVVSGSTVEADDAYDAVTVSNEYLIGQYVASTAKLWVEENMMDETFDTVIFADTSTDDGVARSTGIQQITEPYLKNVNGEYVDAAGKVVDEANKVANPAYCEKISQGKVKVVEVPMGTSGRDVLTAELAENPNIRCVMCYTSLTASQASQYITDTCTPEEAAKYGCFGGGVIGSEYAYLVGAASDQGTDSILRGAIAFGGDDVAQGVAELAYNVFYGEEGVDYQKNTAQSIGVWVAMEANATREATVACVNIFNGTAPEDLTLDGILANEKSVVYTAANFAELLEK